MCFLTQSFNEENGCHCCVTIMGTRCYGVRRLEGFKNHRVRLNIQLRIRRFVVDE
jgi:hypothetical protein